MDEKSKVTRRKVLAAAATAAAGLAAGTKSQAQEPGGAKGQPRKKKQAPPLAERDRNLPVYKAKLIPAEEFTKEYPNPTVLHFQPTDFAVLTDSEDLRLWEKTLKEKVGLEIQPGAAIGVACETCTYCCSDACDQE